MPRSRRSTPTYTAQDGSVWNLHERRNRRGQTTGWNAVKVEDGALVTPRAVRSEQFDDLIERIENMTDPDATEFDVEPDLPFEETEWDVQTVAEDEPDLAFRDTERVKRPRRKRKRRPQVTTKWERPKDNPGPSDVTRAGKLFEEFHDYDPKDVGRFPFEVPDAIYLVGACKWVTYRSDKWGDGTIDYIHKIDSYPRVRCGLVSLDGGIEGRRVAVPRKIQGTQTLTQLGLKSLGMSFVDHDGEEIEITTPKCQWFWSRKGRALLCVRERKKLVAIIWGGDLNVEARGIVG